MAVPVKTEEREFHVCVFADGNKQTKQAEPRSQR